MKGDWYCLSLNARQKDGSVIQILKDIREFEFINIYRGIKDSFEGVHVDVKYKNTTGWNQGDWFFRDSSYGGLDKIYSSAYGTCSSYCTGAPQFKPDVLPPEPIEYTTEEGCNITVSFDSLVLNNDGNVGGLWRIEPSPETARNSGGIIGGCNFAPTMFYDGGGGGQPPRTFPAPDGDFDPGTNPLLDAALAGAVGALINQLLEEALEKTYPGAKYRMEAPCDKDASGNPLVWEKEIPPATSTDALGFRLTAIHEQISQHLAWRTPICDEQPQREGDFRTIHFRSASPSPYSSSRLRKRFRYRSTSGLGLGEVVDYWKDFTFESGPVVVSHLGSAWGTPKVFAATEDEGKRVIRHAAGEAGIDPDQVGRWRIGSSDSSRLGVSDTMSIDTEGGFYRITSRDGSDGKPIVAT
jgi:hypothetical protein